MRNVQMIFKLPCYVQGQHAQYQVHLESVYPEYAHLSFYIAPELGYQRQTFIMGTTNHSMLDFEDIPFQQIRLKVGKLKYHLLQILNALYLN